MSIATKEPTEITAGDTIVWSRSFPDFPASAWTLTYRLLARAGLAPRDFGGTASGDDHLVNLQASFTLLFSPGDYVLQGFITDGTNRYQVYKGALKVLPDPATVDSLDSRTFLEKALEQIEAMILEGAIRAPIEFAYGGITTKIINLADAFKVRDMIKAQIVQAEAVARGKQRRILTRFTAPR